MVGADGSGAPPSLRPSGLSGVGWADVCDVLGLSTGPFPEATVADLAPYVPTQSWPSPAQLTRLAELFRQAERPLVIVGGSTWDLERRVSEHNLGLGAAYTRRRRPVELVWAGDYERVDEAYAMEKRIQGWSRAKRQALIDGRTDELTPLSSRSWAARRARATSTDQGGPASRPGQSGDQGRGAS